MMLVGFCIIVLLFSWDSGDVKTAQLFLTGHISSDPAPHLRWCDPILVAGRLLALTTCHARSGRVSLFFDSCHYYRGKNRTYGRVSRDGRDVTQRTSLTLQLKSGMTSAVSAMRMSSLCDSVRIPRASYPFVSTMFFGSSTRLGSPCGIRNSPDAQTHTGETVAQMGVCVTALTRDWELDMQATNLLEK